MYRFQLVILLLVVFFTNASGQGNKTTGLVRGSITKEPKGPANNVKVSIPSLDLTTVTDGDGNFEFNKVPFGAYSMVISGSGISTQTIAISVNKALTELEEISVEQGEGRQASDKAEIPTIRFEENNTSNGDGQTNSSGNGPIYTGRDPFLSSSIFTLNYYGFKPRGYGFSGMETQVNGVYLNDIESRFSPFGQLNLSDVFHGRDITYGLGASEYMYGGSSGSEYIDASAADQRKETRISYRYSNGNFFKNRIMFTKSSGLNAHGWAYSVSVSKRWDKEGYIPGTFYDGYSYYAAVSKVKGRHQLNFIAFGSPTSIGRSRATTHEADSLAGTNYYNPDWGYQDGAKRNANIENTFQPQFIINDVFKLSDNTRFNFAVGFQFGKRSNSFIDNYGGTPYQPDYYTKMPSYYLLPSNYLPSVADSLRKQLASNPQLMQINWSEIYQANRENFQTVNNANGISGNTYTGLRSIYVISDAINNIKKWSFNVNLQHVVNEHISLYTGLTEISQSTENYTQLADLLGGDYFVNYNLYAASNYPGNNQYLQYNLKTPNQILKVGDKYGYDYINMQNLGWWWGQGKFDYNSFNFFAAGTAGFTEFNRIGQIQNGIFPNNSYGATPANMFFIYSGKAGVTYNLNSHNSFFLNGEYKTQAPTFENSYISPKLTDYTGGDKLAVETIKSGEAGYSYKSSKWEAHIRGYLTDLDNVRAINRYYNDAVDQKAFTDYVMDGIGERYMGLESVISLKLTPEFSISGIASMGQAFYTNDPKITIYQDSDPTLTATTDKVYIKNYYLATGPQTAYTLGFNYRSPKKWYVSVNFNYFDHNYVAISIDRRSDQAVGLNTPGSAQLNDILAQEKLPSAFTVDLRAGKSFQLSKAFSALSDNTVFYIDGLVKNLLNNTDIIASGYEQLRYDFTFSNPYEFPNKYSYGYGIIFLINVGLKF